MGKNRATKVYWAATSGTAEGTGGLTAVLDRDDTNSYGPETTTFTNVGECDQPGYCMIYFVVDNYTPYDGDLGTSQGVITAYRGDKVEGKVEIPASAGSERQYTVFTLDSRRGHQAIYPGSKAVPPFFSVNFTATADWYGSMEAANSWSKAAEGAMVYGFRRSQSNPGGLSDLQEALTYSVQDTQGPLECAEADWNSSFAAEGWSECPPGQFLSGLYRAGGKISGADGISELKKAWCCKSSVLPAEWGQCYEQGILAQPGVTSECLPQGGEPTAIVGLHRTGLEELGAIDKAKCCTFKDVGLVDAPPGPPPPTVSFHRRRSVSSFTMSTATAPPTPRRRRAATYEYFSYAYYWPR
jgi:hypothetical protein